VHRGKGCKLIFYFYFLLLKGRGVEVNVFFLPSFDMWKEEGKGMIFIYFLILFFHCGVARDRGSRTFFRIC
jgi:hypothetical protein